MLTDVVHDRPYTVSRICLEAFQLSVIPTSTALPVHYTRPDWCVLYRYKCTVYIPHLLLGRRRTWYNSRNACMHDPESHRIDIQSELLKREASFWSVWC
jgi:hypothetical protein